MGIGTACDLLDLVRYAKREELQFGAKRVVAVQAEADGAAGAEQQVLHICLDCLTIAAQVSPVTSTRYTINLSCIRDPGHGSASAANRLRTLESLI